MQNWRSQQRTSERSKPRCYSDQAIACALRLREVYRLPLRATEGLLRSLVTLLVVDGTGLKVFGEGEWKVRQDGTSKRRTWRKVHLAVDQKTGYVQAAATTNNNISDGQMLPFLLDQIPRPICQVSADGSYDRRTCYEVIARRGAKAAIPPRHGAKIWQHGNCRAERLARDENLRRIRQVGRTKWKRESGYHRRSLVETTMFRLKTIFGAMLRARGRTAQETETMLRLNALNQMTALGMPDAYPI